MSVRLEEYPHLRGTGHLEAESLKPIPVRYEITHATGGSMEADIEVLGSPGVELLQLLMQNNVVLFLADGRKARVEFPSHLKLPSGMPIGNHFRCQVKLLDGPAG